MAKILVVDDEILILNIIQTYLKKDNEIILLNNPEDVLQYLQNNKADLIISDFYMPEMTGLELVKNLRQKENMIPVILMSGSHVEEFEKQEFTAWLKKPFRPAEIQQLVKKVLNL